MCTWKGCIIVYHCWVKRSTYVNETKSANCIDHIFYALIGLLFYQLQTVCACMLSCFSHVQLFTTLWTIAHQVPLFMGFSRQEYWSIFKTLGVFKSPVLIVSLLFLLLGLSTFALYVFWSYIIQFSSVSQSCLTLQPHELQHARPPCPSPTAGVYSNSCPSSRWCHPAMSSSVISFSSCPQSFPASGSFQMSQLLAWGGQSIGV